MNEDYDSIQDWLAAVIANALVDDGTGVFDCHPVAAAVMEALGLSDTPRREWGLKEAGEPEPGILDEQRVSLYKYARDGDEMMVRWITDWKPDPEPCTRCQGQGCDGNCQREWCGSVENVEY